VVEPSVPGAAWTTSPAATVRETTEGHVDVAARSLMGRGSILGGPGYVAEERVRTASNDGLDILTTRDTTTGITNVAMDGATGVAAPQTIPGLGHEIRINLMNILNAVWGEGGRLTKSSVIAAVKPSY